MPPVGGGGGGTREEVGRMKSDVQGAAMMRAGLLYGCRGD
jgi:hypothetical protein